MQLGIRPELAVPWIQTAHRSQRVIPHEPYGERGLTLATAEKLIVHFELGLVPRDNDQPTVRPGT